MGIFSKELKKYLPTMVLITILPIILFESRFFIFLSPLPLIYAFHIYGRKMFFMIIAFSFAIINFFESSLWAFVYIGTTILGAYIFSEIARKKPSLTILLSKTTAILFVFYLGTGFILSEGHLMNTLQKTLSQKLESLPQFLEKELSSPTFKEFGKKYPAQVEHLQNQFKEVSQHADILTRQFLQEKFFGYLASGLLLTFWISVVVLAAFHCTLSSTPLGQWKVPDHVVWLFIASAAFNELSVPLLSPILKNIFIFLLVIYFLQGLSIAIFYFDRKKASAIKKNLGYLILFIFPIFTTAIGFFDLWINFRKFATERSSSS